MSSTSQWESLDTLSLCERGHHPAALGWTSGYGENGNTSEAPAVIAFLWKSYSQITCSLHRFHVVELMFVMSGVVVVVVFVFYTLKVLFCKNCATTSEVI